jgi:putative SOS response-associated peptidase YedK
MCGRFSLDLDADALVQEFVAHHNRFPEWAPSWNIAPTSTIPIVLQRAVGVTEIGPARWSLIPSWSKELISQYPTFNARSETAAQKPTFREAVKHHRCLVPVSGYYEWVTVAGTKTPHYIHDPQIGRAHV